jgi:hypothetical protein
VGDQSLRSLPVFERLQGEQRLRELPPKRRFIAAEPVRDLTIWIRLPQEAKRDVTRCTRGAGPARVKLLLSVCTRDDIQAEFGADSGERPGCPLPG